MLNRDYILHQIQFNQFNTTATRIATSIEYHPIQFRFVVDELFCQKFSLEHTL